MVFCKSFIYELSFFKVLFLDKVLSAFVITEYFKNYYLTINKY